MGGCDAKLGLWMNCWGLIAQYEWSESEEFHKKITKNLAVKRAGIRSEYIGRIAFAIFSSGLVKGRGKR